MGRHVPVGHISYDKPTSILSCSIMQHASPRSSKYSFYRLVLSYRNQTHDIINFLQTGYQLHHKGGLKNKRHLVSSVQFYLNTKYLLSFLKNVLVDCSELKSEKIHHTLAEYLLKVISWMVSNNPVAVVVMIVWHSWIYNYLCNQCLSPLMWVRIPFMAMCTWYNIM